MIPTRHTRCKIRRAAAASITRVVPGTQGVSPRQEIRSLFPTFSSESVWVLGFVDLAPWESERGRKARETDIRKLSSQFSVPTPSEKVQDRDWDTNPQASKPTQRTVNIGGAASSGRHQSSAAPVPRPSPPVFRYPEGSQTLSETPKPLGSLHRQGQGKKGNAYV